MSTFPNLHAAMSAVNVATDPDISELAVRTYLHIVALDSLDDDALEWMSTELGEDLAAIHAAMSELKDAGHLDHIVTAKSVLRLSKGAITYRFDVSEQARRLMHLLQALPEGATATDLAQALRISVAEVRDIATELCRAKSIEVRN